MRQIHSVTEKKVERKAVTEQKGTGFTTDGRESGATVSKFDGTDNGWDANHRRFG